MKIQQIPFLFQKKGVREGKVQAGWVRWGGGGWGGEGIGGKRKRGNGEISNQVQNYDGSGKREKSNRFNEKKK